MVQRANRELTIKQAFREFIAYKSASNMSTATIGNYKESFIFLFKNIGVEEDEPISVLDKYRIYDWVDKMKERGIKISSINHYLRDMRVFLYWCMSEGHLEQYKISMLKGQEEQIKFFSDEEIEKLLIKPDDSDSFVMWRTYTIICFILATGARASTVINIKLDDIDFNRKEIVYTHLKNKQVATVPLSMALEKTIQQYLKMWSFKSPYLFCEANEEQLTVSALRQGLIKYCKKRDVEPRGPHALRHNFARGWVQNNGNAFTLQKMLTHADMQMTKRYVKLFSEDLKKDFEQFSPLDNYKKGSNRTQTVRRT